jgi:hypothetical protein
VKPRLAAGLLSILALCGSACAQVAPAGVRLGMGEGDLLVALPGLRPAHRPARTSTGAVGKWIESVDAGADALGASTRTYYLVAGQLDQVDRTLLLATATDSLQAYARCATELEARLGPGLRSTQGGSDAQFDSVSWSVDDRDIYITRTAIGGRDVVRMVERRRHVVDAGQL